MVVYKRKKTGVKIARRKRTGGKHLTKTQASEARAIAQKTVNKAAESKYFACSSLKNANGMHRARSDTGGIAVRGYATCENKNQDGTQIAYGRSTADNSTEYLGELNMNRTQANGSGSDHEKAQAVVGSYATPSYAASTFILERDYIATNAEAADYETLNAAPYYVRVLRICPRASKFTNTDIDPESDAFVDETGLATGISHTSFGPQELMLYKANSRKYRVVQDMKFTLNCPFTTSNVATGETPTDPLTETNALVTNMSKTGFMKTINMKHDIGKKLYFELGGGTKANSTAGHKNEFILFHTCQLGVNSQASLTSYNATNMLIAGKFVSTFKDL